MKTVLCAANWMNMPWVSAQPAPQKGWCGRAPLLCDLIEYSLSLSSITHLLVCLWYTYKYICSTDTHNTPHIKTLTILICVCDWDKKLTTNVTSVFVSHSGSFTQSVMCFPNLSWPIFITIYYSISPNLFLYCDIYPKHLC